MDNLNLTQAEVEALRALHRYGGPPDLDTLFKLCRLGLVAVEAVATAKGRAVIKDLEANRGRD